ncbi:MAG: trans-sulfuration enzyme family protein [Nitrososphaerales archaeon]
MTGANEKYRFRRPDFVTKARRSVSRKPTWAKIVPHVLPIYQTSVYDYPDLEALDDYYNGLIPGGYIYSRNGLPNSEELGNQVARFEGAEGGVVCSSGMAAISVLLLANLKRGDNIVASSDLYGGTTVLLGEEFSRLGIRTTFADARNLEKVKDAIARQRPKLVLVETISNPTMKVCDIAEIARTTHRMGALLAVDNTFATPFVVRPIELGADIVMHSGTKFLGGHSDLTIGILCGDKKMVKRMSQVSTRFGAIAGPFDCWLASRSLSTWRVRMVNSCANAMKLAEYLASRKDMISRVYYPGLASDPGHRVAEKMFYPTMFGGMLSFDLKGGLRAANTFIRELSRVTLTPSLGGVRTTISHPGKTSHRHITQTQRIESGISDAMIRVSAGIEEYRGIQDDFAAALNATESS